MPYRCANCPPKGACDGCRRRRRQRAQAITNGDTSDKAGRKPAASKHVLPDDGIIDHIAVAVAVSGSRRVRLTRQERELAARHIVAAGGGIEDLREHLGATRDEATELYRDLTRPKLYAVESDSHVA